MKNQLNEITVSYNRSLVSPVKISSSKHAYEVCKEIIDKDRCNIYLKEYFYIILLNRANDVVGYYRLSEGGITGTVADIRIAFSIAVKSLACGMILFHNHPSGTMKPSNADKNLTINFKEAGKILNINILDHLIVDELIYYSFADNGLI